MSSRSLRRSRSPNYYSPPRRQSYFRMVRPGGRVFRPSLLPRTIGPTGLVGTLERALRPALGVRLLRSASALRIQRRALSRVSGVTRTQLLGLGPLLLRGNKVSGVTRAELLAMRGPKNRSVCVQRQVRKEVIFAKGVGGRFWGPGNGGPEMSGAIHRPESKVVCRR